MQVDLKVQVNGLYGVHLTGNRAEFHFPGFAGGIRHGAYVAIPTDRIQKFAASGKPVFPRACLPGPQVSSIFALTEPLTLTDQSSTNAVHATNNLLRLADAFEPGGGSGGYCLKKQKPLLVLKNGALNTFATPPFDKQPIELIPDERRNGTPMMVHNLVEWRGQTSRTIKVGDFKIQLKYDRPVTISVYALPNSGITEDRDMRHFIAFYNLLERKPKVPYYPRLAGPYAQIDGYPGCVVGTQL